MDFEKGLIAAILRVGYDKYLDMNLDSKVLSPGSQKIIEFISDHYQQYGKTPNVLLVENVTGGSFSDALDEPISFWVEHLRRKFIYDLVEKVHTELPELNNNNPYQAVEKLRETILESDSSLVQGSKLVPVMDEFRVDAFFNKIWAGEVCIPTPWQGLTDRSLGGWRPQDLIVFAARPAQGKTFLLIMIAQSAWRAGFRVLFVTTEMSQNSIELRNIFLSGYLPTMVSYGKMKRGMISNQMKELIMKKIASEKRSGALDRYLITGDGFDVHLENIEAKIREFKPHLVCIDGTYLLRCKSIKTTDKYQRISELFDRIKSVAKRTEVAIAVTTQLNRPQKQGKNQKLDIDRIAFSDNVGMVSDYVFFLNQEEGMREQKKMDIECGKIREGEDYSTIHLNWNFDDRDFSEIPKSQSQPVVQQQQSQSQPKQTSFFGMRPPED